MTSSHITPSGGLFTHHFIEAIQQASFGHPAAAAETFGLQGMKALSPAELEKQIAIAWELLTERWDSLGRGLPGMDISSLRERWVRPLFTMLEFELDYQRADLVLEDDMRFPVSYLGRPVAVPGKASIPIHTVLANVDFDVRPEKGMRGIKGLAPHDVLQRYLNLTRDERWGLLTNGLRLRLLRDYHHSTSRGYVEFDLEEIFEERDFAAFRGLYRLCHVSRFVVTGADGKAETPLDLFYQHAQATGVKVGEDLRQNVRAAIEILANGFLRATPGLLDHLTSMTEAVHYPEIGDLPAEQAFFHDVLTVIYRMLFLLFAEQRGMLPGRGSLYAEQFSLTALRTRAERPLGEDEHLDLWERLGTTFHMLEKGAPELGIFGYNGALFGSERTPTLNPSPISRNGGGAGEGAALHNSDLLRAVRALTTVERDGALQRVSYLDLSVEEIGSVYESLLDYTPRISRTHEQVDGREIAPGAFFLDPRGAARKTTGSYYTHPSLVNQLIQSALLPVLAERLEAAVPSFDGEQPEVLNEAEREAAEAAVLDLRVVDPACGSGAFLISANNTLALTLARVRSGDLYPPEQVIRRARRDVLAHCIHGVDLNPMAVELCKVSLWINAAVDDAPLNFLDHHIKCGNSLVGASAALLEAGIPDEAYQPVSGDDKTLARSLRAQNKEERDGQMSLWQMTVIETEANLHAWRKLTQMAEDEPRVAERLYLDYQSAEAYRQRKLAMDLWTSAFFWKLDGDTPRPPTTQTVRQAQADPKLLPGDVIETANELVERYRFFHWELEFEDVFAKGGFDVILGNPPWDIVQEESGKTYEFDKLKNWYNNGIYEILKGRRDLYKLFITKSIELISVSGRKAFIVPLGVFVEEDGYNLRQKLFEKGSVISLQHFQNHRKAFFSDVDSRYRFVALTYSHKSDFSHSYSTVISLPSDIGNEAWVSIDHSDLRGKLGEDFSAVLYPSKPYFELHTKVMGNLNSMELLEFDVIAEFHATTDKNKGLLFDEQASPNDWRILKNRSIHQFDYRFAEADKYIKKEVIEQRCTQKGLDPNIWLNMPRLLFRDIARNDDTRTLLCCLAPPGFVSSYDTPMVYPTGIESTELQDTLLYLCGLFNSFSFDFLIRPFVDKHIKGYVLKRLLVPKFDKRNMAHTKIVDISKKLISGFSNNNHDELVILRGKLEFVVAKLLGLSIQELSFIMSNFSDAKNEDIHFGLNSKKIAISLYDQNSEF